MRPRTVSPSNGLRLEGDSGRTIDTVDVPEPPARAWADEEAARPLTALERTIAAFGNASPAKPRGGRPGGISLPAVVRLVAAAIFVLALARWLWRG